MPYVIIVDQFAGQWEIVDQVFDQQPTDNPLYYDTIVDYDIVPVIKKLGMINLRHNLTNALGTGKVVEI